MQERGKILELTTLVPPDRPTVLVDGEAYEMHRFDEMDATRQQLVVNAWDRYTDISNRGFRALQPAGEGEEEPAEVTLADLAALDRCRHTIIVIAMPDLPADARARLTSQQRDALVQDFFRRVVEQNEARRAATETARKPGRPTGASSSRDSSASTAAPTPAAG